MSKKDQLERIADAIDGGGDYHQGKPDEVGYLTRIANYLEDNPGGGGGDNLFLIHMSCRYVYGNPNIYTDYVVTEAIEDIKQAAIDKKAIVVLCDVTASGPPYPTTYMFTNLSYYIHQGFITITGSTNDLPNAKSGQITRTEIKLNGNDTLTTTIKEYRYSLV